MSPCSLTAPSHHNLNLGGSIIADPMKNSKGLYLPVGGSVLSLQRVQEKQCPRIAFHLIYRPYRHQHLQTSRSSRKITNFLTIEMIQHPNHYVCDKCNRIFLTQHQAKACCRPPDSRPKTIRTWGLHSAMNDREHEDHDFIINIHLTDQTHSGISSLQQQCIVSEQYTIIKINIKYVDSELTYSSVSVKKNLW